MRNIGFVVLSITLWLCRIGAAQTVEGSGRFEKPEDPSKWFDLILGAQAGGGLDQFRDPTAHANVTVGMSPVVVDLGYDRIAARNGFSAEISGFAPVFRLPGPQKDEKKHYVRFYAEPGLGYRAGGPPFGGYASMKIRAVLMSDDRIYRFVSLPYVEYQRRFPFNSPLQGDNRVSIGVMLGLCHHCGLD